MENETFAEYIKKFGLSSDDIAEYFRQHNISDNKINEVLSVDEKHELQIILEESIGNRIKDPYSGRSRTVKVATSENSSALVRVVGTRTFKRGRRRNRTTTNSNKERYNSALQSLDNSVAEIESSIVKEEKNHVENMTTFEKLMEMIDSRMEAK